MPLMISGWGAKVTGTMGRTAIGVLTASDEFPGYAWQDGVNPNEGRNTGYMIGRAKHSLGSDSYIGTLYSGSSFAGKRNHTVGGDTQFRFLNGHQTTFSVLSSMTSEPDSADQSGTAVNWTWNYGSRNFVAAAQMQTTRQGNLRFELSRSREYWQNRAFWQNALLVTGNVQLRNWLGFGGHIRTGESLYYWSDPAYMGLILSTSLGVNLRLSSRLSQGFNIFHEKFHRQSTGAHGRRAPPPGSSDRGV